MSVKRYPAQYQPQDNAGSEVATMVLASDYDALLAQAERLAGVIHNFVDMMGDGPDESDVAMVYGNLIEALAAYRQWKEQGK